MCNIKQKNKLFFTAKNSWMQMKPEARPIKFTNGHAHSYMKNKVDKIS